MHSFLIHLLSDHSSENCARLHAPLFDTWCLFTVGGQNMGDLDVSLLLQGAYFLMGNQKRLPCTTASWLAEWASKILVAGICDLWNLRGSSVSWCWFFQKKTHTQRAKKSFVLKFFLMSAPSWSKLLPPCHEEREERWVSTLPLR